MARRTVLIAVSGAAAGLAMAAVGCGSTSEDDPAPHEPAPGEIEAGLVSDYAVGTIRRIETGPVFVARDALGLYAMSAMCTHLGCTVNIATDRLPCPCHGSVFDLDGNVLQGPATDPLRHYAVYVEEGGRVVVATDEPVATSTRTAV